MQTIPYPLYRAAQAAELDRLAIEEAGISGRELMERAGAAAFAALRRRWPRARRLAVFCGGGNNGGDGYVVARLAQEAGLDVRILQLAAVERLGPDARQVADAAVAAGIPAESYSGQPLAEFDLVVDGMLGTGLSGPVRGRWAEAIEAIGASALPVVALDLPSGLQADTGAVEGAALNAALTVTFIALKQGLFTGEGPARCGTLCHDALGVPEALFAQISPSAQRIDLARLTPLLPPRRRDAHKGHFGHLLVVGGDHGASGAARMAAEAAARVGAGLVSVATRPAHAAAMAAARPELMCHGVKGPADLHPLLERADVVAVGPGLGRDPWGRALLAFLLDVHQPLVLDADALTLLAADPLYRDNWVLTPHPGEAARLLGLRVSEIQRDRFTALAGIEASYGGTVVLKGVGTLVLGPSGEATLCSDGNPGMASGGMGDVLTGIIAGLAAQGLPLELAARLGVTLHAAAGDRAAQEGERGMLATDLLPHLRRLANPIS